LLYTKGQSVEQRQMISMVGTRNISAYGKKFIEDFVAYLADKPVCIVSGLALGVDAHAHQMALQHGLPTIGVLAYGFKQFYPAKNKLLSEQMIAQGGQLITEFPPSHQIVREQFIRRNRIIAGLSKLTVVVETAYGGGSISTVNFANQYNREVYALPGRFNDKYSQGCNQLINQNKARILTDFSQIIDDLGINQTPKMGSLFDLPPDLTPEQNTIYNLLKAQNLVPLEDLIESSQLGMAQTMAVLLQLEMLDLVKPNSKKEYQWL
jgi:DNA processing protein